MILYGLPEPSGADSSERKSNDEQCFRNLAKAEFKIDDLDIDQIFRLGKRTENKSRPLLVRLQDSQARKYILKNAKSLRNSSSYKNVYVSPDLTPKERKLNKQLYQELKYRKDHGEKDLIIRNGKIVSRTPNDNVASSKMDISSTNKQ